jgi:hypothetical protein
MSYKPVGLAGMWGLDCDAPLTPTLLQQLETVDLSDFWPGVCPKGTFVQFFERYVPLPGNKIGGDFTLRERDLLITAKKPVVLVQHVRGDIGGTPGWPASAAQGDADALYALQYADQLGYTVTWASDWTGATPLPAIVQDIENVKPGTDSFSSAKAFRARIESAKSARHVIYQGFNCGMDTEQLASVGSMLYSDFGNRTPPPGRAFAMKQHGQKRILGMWFDLDRAMIDDAGEQLYGMADVDDVAA